MSEQSLVSVAGLCSWHDLLFLCHISVNFKYREFHTQVEYLVHILMNVKVNWASNEVLSRCSSKTLPAKTCSCRRAMLARLLQSNILSPYSYICLSNNSTCNITPARTHDQTLGFLLPLAAAGLKIQVSLCNMSADFQSAVKVIIFFRSLLRLCSAWWRRVGGWQ